MTPPTCTLTIRPEPRADDPRGLRRLRAALKMLLRRFGLRCLAITPAIEEGETDD